MKSTRTSPGGMSGKRLLLFFTPGMSLGDWNRIGMLNREIAIYKALASSGVQVSFVTYGGPEDLKLQVDLADIRILCNRWGLPTRVYAALLPLLHGFHIARSDVLKTNQIKGAEIALRAAQMWRKPLIARCGFLRSDFAMRQFGANSQSAIAAAAYEDNLFKKARLSVVTTETMKDEVVSRVPELSERMCVIPNYVATDVFTPSGTGRTENNLIFIGRLEPQKNLESLLGAIEALEVKLKVIGTGSLQKDLQVRFRSLEDRIEWLGNVPNHELPKHLNQASLFVLPSHYEGHPKALLEAMSCETPVLAADSPGIREIIRDGENGLLCQTTPASIREGIGHYLDNAEKGIELGRNGRRYVVERFALDRVLDLELGALNMALGT